MPPRKIIPVTTKRLIASTFGFDSPQTPPVDNHKFSSQNELANSPNNKLKKSSSSFEESSWEKFKKKTQRKSLLWIWSSLFVGAWLVAITALYAIHIEKSHEKGMIKVIETHYDTFSCQNDTTCSAPTPYCDTRYSFQCSECISSSHCTDHVKKICDFYGTRACHECLVDRDCTGSAKRCDNTETRTCIECFDHTDCASNPTN